MRLPDNAKAITESSIAKNRENKNSRKVDTDAGAYAADTGILR